LSSLFRIKLQELSVLLTQHLTLFYDEVPHMDDLATFQAFDVFGTRVKEIFGFSWFRGIDLEPVYYRRLETLFNA
jgi:hypothetical protein